MNRNYEGLHIRDYNSMPVFSVKVEQNASLD